MTVERRREIVSNLGYCFNCLARSHNLNSCTSMGACIKCAQLHHTLLHLRQQQRSQREATQGRSRSQHHSPSPRRPHLQQREHQRQHRHRQQQQHRHHQQHHQQQQHRHHQQHRQHQQQPQQPTTQRSVTSPAQPDSLILAQAIKSLADVLCASKSASSVG